MGSIILSSYSSISQSRWPYLYLQQMMKVEQLEQDIQVSETCESESLVKTSRSGFISKVYALLSIQLLITVLFVIPSTVSPSYAAFQANNMWIFYLALVGSLCFIMPLAYCKGLSQRAPANEIMLFGFTLCESYMVSLICSFYTPESVLQAAVATCAATIGLTVYAIRTDADFTQWAHWMMGFFWSFFFVTTSITLINIFFIRSDFITALVAIAIACVYSIYLIIDTQLILGGKNQELTLDNYVLGAVLLYIDIIQLFLQILKILGKKKN